MRCRIASLVLGLVFLGLVSIEVAADDWPQWLGPQRDSVWRETGIVQQFADKELKVKWQQKIGGGYTGPAVADGRVFVMDYLTEGDTTPNPSRRNKLDGTERVLCFAVDDGRLLWKHEYDRPYNISFPAGPRVTPTVDGDRVYTLGSEGNLLCLRTRDGSVVWSRDLPKDYDMETPIWGFAGHPLVDGDKLICLVGGTGSIAVAFNKHDGKEIWRSLSASETGYSPPSIIQAGGKRQLLIWHAQSLNSLDPETGKPYWSEPLQPNYGMAIATPRFDGKHVFVGAIVNIAMLLELDANRPAAELIWKGASKDRGLGPVMSTPYLEDGYMYGVDRRGELRCVELKTGEHVWSSFQATRGDDREIDSPNMFLVKHEDRFFLANDLGELIIAKLSPDGYQEISRAQMIDPQTVTNKRKVVWSHPAFANRCVFARNDQRIVCISLAEAE